MKCVSLSQFFKASSKKTIAICIILALTIGFISDGLGKNRDKPEIIQELLTTKFKENKELNNASRGVCGMIQ